MSENLSVSLTGNGWTAMYVKSALVGRLLRLMPDDAVRIFDMKQEDEGGVKPSDHPPTSAMRGEESAWPALRKVDDAGPHPMSQSWWGESNWTRPPGF